MHTPFQEFFTQILLSKDIPPTTSHAGEVPLPLPIAQGLAHEAPAIRRAALLALCTETSTEKSVDLIGILEKAFQDTSPLVRREAAEQAGRHPQAAKNLLPLLEKQLLLDEEPLCRESAAFALGETGTSAGAKALVRSLEQERTSLVREAIAGGLGAIGAPCSLSAVLSLCQKEKPAVRRRALVTLAAFSGDQVENAIEHAKNDRDRHVRETAEWLARPEYEEQ